MGSGLVVTTTSIGDGSLFDIQIADCWLHIRFCSLTQPGRSRDRPGCYADRTYRFAKLRAAVPIPATITRE